MAVLVRSGRRSVPPLRRALTAAGKVAVAPGDVPRRVHAEPLEAVPLHVLGDQAAGEVEAAAEPRPHVLGAWRTISSTTRK